ncbi:hypothetical protein ACFC0M_10360 [Streptomyces sp. NPDC056149]|uniref:hypothetical protein n=1 Tax=Streptomyces sp. NPDC056149 TaxID=3345728 RepID=UPI0035E0AECD
MRKSIARRAGISVAAVAVLAGVTSCQGGSDKAEGGRRDSGKGSVTHALSAAYKKTAAAKSAKVTMSMTTPAGMPDSGVTKMSGVMGWDPMVMDVTMTESPLGAKAGDGAEKTHMIWLDDAMYVDMNERPEEFDGKRWGKLDLGAALKQSDNAKLVKQMTAGLDDMKQDPAQQLAMLLGSPDVKHLGSGEVNGERAEHYKGSLTIEEGLKGAKTAQALSPEEREKLLANAKKAGVKGYTYDVWVNGDDYPVKMDMDVKTPQGAISTTMDLSDYGTKASVKAPPADDTVDLIKELQKLTTQGA